MIVTQICYKMWSIPGVLPEQVPFSTEQPWNEGYTSEFMLGKELVLKEKREEVKAKVK